MANAQCGKQKRMVAHGFSPNTEAGEHARPRALPDAPRGQPLCARQLSKPPEHLRAPDVFREGAENCARGGRAPVLISEFRFKKTRQGQTTTAHGDNRRIKIKIPLFFSAGRHSIGGTSQRETWL
jgi:hypothetical protein